MGITFAHAKSIEVTAYVVTLRCLCSIRVSGQKKMHGHVFLPPPKNKCKCGLKEIISLCSCDYHRYHHRDDLKMRPAEKSYFGHKVSLWFLHLHTHCDVTCVVVSFRMNGNPVCFHRALRFHCGCGNHSSHTHRSEPSLKDVVPGAYKPKIKLIVPTLLKYSGPL